MSYFTSWDANVFLCLTSFGLPGDLVETFVKKIRRVHREFELERVRDYHCDRGKFVDMTEHQMMYFSRGDLLDQIWHFPKAVSNLSIPVQFYQKYSVFVEHFTAVVKDRLLDQRITYFKQSVPGEGDQEWSQDMIKWFEGFHPGRFLLMDQEYINSLTPTLHDHHLLWRVDSIFQFVEWYNSVFEGNKHIEDLL